MAKLYAKSYPGNQFFTPEAIASIIQRVINADAGYAVLNDTPQASEAAEVGLGYAPPFRTMRITIEEVTDE